MDRIWIAVFSSECAEDGRVCLRAVWIAGLRCPALQREVAVSRVYERVLSQAVECVLEAVQGADVWVTVEPTYGTIMQTQLLVGLKSLFYFGATYCDHVLPIV